MVARAEAEFLNESDYGRLLPVGYDRPSRKWIQFYMINMIAFLMFLAVTVYYGWNQLDPSDRWLPGTVLAIGCLGTVVNQRAQASSDKRNHRELVELQGKGHS
jgi:hypothetical protein